MIRIGSPSTPAQFLPRVETRDDDLRRHLGKPWLNSTIAAYYDLTPNPTDKDSLSDVDTGFSEKAVSRHTLISGTTGTGKSRVYLLIAGQLLLQGCSMVAVDPKEDTLLHLIELARQAGVKAHNIHAFLPRQQGGIPGWNPLAGADPREAAEEFSDTIWAASERGPQMGDALSNALVVITAHGLALPELARLLRSKVYRDRILALPDPEGLEDDMDIAREYFQHDYADSFAGAVTNKFSQVTRNRYLRSVISTESNTVHFDDLWKNDALEPRDEQRLIVVHLDSKNLSEEAMRFLGGSVAWRTFRAADRVGGPQTRPVVLGLDEIGLAEGYLAGALGKILAIARGKNLRLITSTQYVDQLPMRVKKDLLKLTNARAYLRIDEEDAAAISKSLAPGKTFAMPDRILVSRVRALKSEAIPFDKESFVLHDGDRTPLAVRNPFIWEAYGSDLGPTSSRDCRRSTISLLAHAGGLSIDRLYIHDPTTGKWLELFNITADLHDSEWFIDGPAPVRLVITFPRVEFSDLPGGSGDAVSRWTHALTKLKDQEVVIEDKTVGRPATVYADTVPDAAPPDAFLQEVLANGYTQEAADAAYRKRREMIKAWSEVAPTSSLSSKSPKPGRGAPSAKPPNSEEEQKPNENGLF